MESTRELAIYAHQNSCNTVFPKDMVCLRNISVDTLHKGKTEDNNNNNNNAVPSWKLSPNVGRIEILETLDFLTLNLNDAPALPLDALRRQMPSAVILIYSTQVPPRLTICKFLMLSH
jgi:hypothetical protein